MMTFDDLTELELRDLQEMYRTLEDYFTPTNSDDAGTKRKDN